MILQRFLNSTGIPTMYFVMNVTEPQTQALIAATGSTTAGKRPLPDGRRSGGDEGLGSRL